jgi:SAM-dependent MidA family methyltransferase
MDKLKEIVIDRVKKSGRITFAEFMEMALYYPGLGYYEKPNPFGVTGSYYTSVNASKSFGNSIAKSFQYIFNTLQLKPCILEVGAGSGYLAKDILDYLKFKNNGLYENIHYYIIEKSNYLINEQKNILNKHLGKVFWVTLEELQSFEGIVFSNELIDAFPVHRIIKIGEEIKELYVIFYDDKLQFYPDKISSNDLFDYIKTFNINMIDKQMIEINLNIKKWIRQISTILNRGLILTIDYGDISRNLYTSQRMDGTVTCYFKHTQNNDFFERIGFQDITAFVDFTALMEYGKDYLLETYAFLEQWQFLLLNDIIEEINKAKSDLERASIRSLILPKLGFGSNFHVLIQGKNVDINSNFKYGKKASEIFKELSNIYSI